ncbi:signal peptidase II [Schnuerera sp.]|uniref:signal peptidase II n=1 Tax=Schnuerera sp. TaxID=2794844 RepID=UPI002C083F70|nr:signal peptidase II [Schnuerera sp.]HSH36177.1 signal peptidase II [Schnuerera sp.]
MLYLIAITIVILDQVSKFAAIKYLKGHSPYIIVENLFQLCYVENYGAAFGILQNRKIFFVIVTFIVIISIVFFLVRYNHSINKPLKIGLVMLLAGAIGNLIDRIRFGYVVDFISFKLAGSYDFPVFNVADIFIVAGTLLIMTLIMFNKHEY